MAEVGGSLAMTLLKWFLSDPYYSYISICTCGPIIERQVVVTLLTGMHGAEHFAHGAGRGKGESPRGRAKKRTN